MSLPIDSRGSVSNATRYAYIDALRGYAVLGVIATHCAQHVSDLATPVRWVSDHGRFGVQLFFVVSAVTLLSSSLTKADGAFRFYARRLLPVPHRCRNSNPVIAFEAAGLYLILFLVKRIDL